MARRTNRKRNVLEVFPKQARASEAWEEQLSWASLASGASNSSGTVFRSEGIFEHLLPDTVKYIEEDVPSVFMISGRDGTDDKE